MHTVNQPAVPPVVNTADWYWVQLMRPIMRSVNNRVENQLECWLWRQRGMSVIWRAKQIIGGARR
jgi:hypothetical protein